MAHRWFAEGEGWAYHPKLKQQVPKLVDALDSVLKHSSNRAFRIRLGRHLLVGERVADRDCLDPRAAGRSPFIVRAVVVSWGTTESEVAEILEKLESVVPTERGANPGFQIILGSGPNDQLEAGVEPPRALPIGRAIAMPPALRTSQAAWDRDDEIEQLEHQLRLAQEREDQANRSYERERTAKLTARSYLAKSAVAGTVGLLTYLLLTLLLEGSRSSAVFLLFLGQAAALAFALQPFLTRTRPR